MLAAWIADIEQSRPKGGQKRRVMGKHRHFALRARYDHLLNVARDE
jgi:hypothetical protein